VRRVRRPLLPVEESVSREEAKEAKVKSPLPDLEPSEHEPKQADAAAVEQPQQTHADAPEN